jgi:hypothetical protein
MTAGASKLFARVVGPAGLGGGGHRGLAPGSRLLRHGELLQ